MLRASSYVTMQTKSENTEGTKKRDRILGDEWLDWDSGDSEEEIREGKRTFLMLSTVTLIAILLLIFLFWYLVLPRFRLFGGPWALLLTVAIIVGSVMILTCYIILFVGVYSKKNYMNVCLQRVTNFFIFLYPFFMNLAKLFGISRDRLGHSFIKVSNQLVCPVPGLGTVLVLLPRCLNKDLKREAKEICESYDGVVIHTASGGTEARRIIRETAPRAIVAAACERDLVNGIQDVAPRIPVIGIPNTRPTGPCKNTTIDLDEFRSALEFFCSRA
ncbi:MAG: DUF116 domain-containing protein [bacterium]|nr:MAG: DUF116 domain-containing protein [bacterium]